MTSPDPKSSKGPESEGGGLLPAALAGVGILLVAGLILFGGDDKSDEAAQNQDGKSQHSASAQSARGGKGGVAARAVDKPSNSNRVQPKLNPRVANAIVGGGMAPEKAEDDEEPTSFDSKEDEIVYWEDQLREANRMLEIRERAVEHIPRIEEKIREGNDPVNGLADFERRKQVVKDNLEKAQKRVTEVEDKLAALRG